MLYISIDLETTGLNPETHEILTFSGILEDTEKKLPFNECPKFNVYLSKTEICGSVYALNMNMGILSTIVTYNSLKDRNVKIEMAESINGIFLPQTALPYYFYLWCLIHHEGKRFDLLRYLTPEKWEDDELSCFKTISGVIKEEKPICINVAGKNFGTFDKRFLDKLDRLRDIIIIRQKIIDPGILFVDWDKDNQIPSLGECKKRAGIPGIVTHDSLEDAWDVIQLLRKFY